MKINNKYLFIFVVCIFLYFYYIKESFGASSTQPTTGTSIVWTSQTLTGQAKTDTIPTTVSVTNGVLYQLQGNFYTNSITGINIGLSNCNLYSDANARTYVANNKFYVYAGSLPNPPPSNYNTSFWFRPLSDGPLTFFFDYPLPFGIPTVYQFTISITQLVIKQSVAGSTTYVTNNSTQGADFAAGTNTNYLGRQLSTGILYGAVTNGTLIYASNGPVIKTEYLVAIQQRTVSSTIADMANFIIYNITNNFTLTGVFYNNGPQPASGTYNYISIYNDGSFKFFNVPVGTAVTLSGETNIQTLYLKWV